MPDIKFATLVNPKVLKDLREFAKEQGISISKIVSEALKEHLQRQRVRAVFTSAMDEVLHDNEDLLKRLAK